MSNYVQNEKAGKLEHYDGFVCTWPITTVQNETKHTTVAVRVLEAGVRIFPGHAHSGEETMYIVSGSGKVRIGEDFFAVNATDLVFIPAGTMHMLWNCSAQPMKVISFYAPDSEASVRSGEKLYDFPQFNGDPLG